MNSLYFLTRHNTVILFLSLAMLASCGNSNRARKDMTVFDGTFDHLTGKAEEIETIKHFPYDDYKTYKVWGIGSFYVDDGDDLIKRGIRLGNSWEPHFGLIMKEHIKPGSTVIDIGAHIGAHTMTLSKYVGDQGKVIAFEPQLKLFSELVHNVSLNNRTNVIAYRCALGNECKEVEMDPTLHENEAVTAIGKGGDRAQMIALDSLELDDVSFIKIDVENYEYEVLKGAEKTIRKYHPYMIVEIMGNSYAHVPNRTELVDKTVKFIEEMGYDVKFIEGSWSDWLATPKPN